MVSKTIITKDSEGRPNGTLIPLWSVTEAPDLRPDQVYVTTIRPGMRKGPHLHKRRRGVFFCVKGKVQVSVRLEKGSYAITTLRPGSGHAFVPAGFACALYNPCSFGEAIVLNMPSPSWSIADPDEHPVEDWSDPEDWNERLIDGESPGVPL